jgi:TetR/AcrR family transcriptional regulator
MHGQDRRKQLLKVAVDVFARQGFSGTKTRDIAAAAGVSEAILFRHFASKEDLYHAILDAKADQESGSDFLAALQGFADQRDDAGLIRYIASAILQSFRQDPAFHRLILFASLEGHLLAGLFRERFGLPVFDFLKRYLAMRQKEGAFRKVDPQIAVMFMTGSIVHLAMVRYLFHCRKPNIAEDTAAREMADMALAALVNPRSAKRRQKTTKKKRAKDA